MFICIKTVYDFIVILSVDFAHATRVSYSVMNLLTASTQWMTASVIGKFEVRGNFLHVIWWGPMLRDAPSCT